jgi:tetratricopeptide (TPR) repeat protein
VLKPLTALLISVSLTAYSQTHRLDSLRLQFLQTQTPAEKAQTGYDLGYEYLGINLDSSLVWANRTLTWARQAQQPTVQAKALLVKGYSISRKESFARAYPFFVEALSIAEINNLPAEEARALVALGMVNNYMGDYAAALRVYRTAEEIADDANNTILLSWLYSNIAGIYNNLNDLEQALIYRKKALELSITGKDERLPSALSNMGRQYVDMGQYRKGLLYLFQSVHMMGSKLVCIKPYVLENIGFAYLKLNVLDSAEYFLKQGLEASMACNEVIPQTALWATMGEVKLARHDAPGAVADLQVAYQKAVQVGAVRECARATQLLAKAYEQMGHYSKALTTFRQFQALSDSLYSVDKLTALSRSEASLEYALIRKNQEMAQRIESMKQANILAREVRLRNAFIGSFLIALVFAALYFYYFRRRKKYSEQLERLNREIQDQKEELLQLNNTLYNLNHGLEARIAERTQEISKANAQLVEKNARLGEYAFYNAHKLRSPVSTILGLTHLFNNPMITDGERNEIIQRLKDATHKLDTVVRQIQTIVRE